MKLHKEEGESRPEALFSDTSFGAKTLNNAQKIQLCSKQDLGKWIRSQGKTGLWCKTMPLAKWDSICISLSNPD